VRRAQLAEVARRHDIAIIENDVLGPLVEDRAPPLAYFAPERTLYVTSFSKITVPGLRVGYLVAPDRYAAAVANRHLVSNWMATPLVAEIATKWVTDGTAMDLVRWQRDALRRRHEIAGEALQGVAYRTCRDALHIWLQLPDDRSEEAFVAQARLRGVAIAPGASFRIAETPWKPAVRISLGSTTEGELQAGLGVVTKLLLGDPEHLLLAI
jgi:DNA-binding transcriptional MocR family regulator